MGISTITDHIKINIKMPNPSQEPPASSKAPNEDSRTLMFLAPSKPRKRAKIWQMGISKTSDHIQINIKMTNPSQDPSVSSEFPNEDLKDTDILCTFKEPKFES